MAAVFILLVAVKVSALDRCQEFVQEVRTANTFYNGLNYPYWYGVGQLKTESGCRSDLTAFDGGQGLAQFMPVTMAAINKICTRCHLQKLNPYKPADSIKAAAYLIAQNHRTNFAPDKPMWIDYQSYNGGAALLKKEYQRAGKANHELMRVQCKRNIITLKSGKLLNLCDVNYDYSRHIYDYAKPYRLTTDQTPFNFW